MSKQILVIDDEKAIRNSFTLTFEESEYMIDTAESGEKGIEITQEKKYDLIFLDLKMPGMDGVETLRKLRETDKDTPIYIITAFHQEFLDKLRKAEEDGIDFEVIRKPVDSEQLTHIVKGILDKPGIY